MLAPDDMYFKEIQKLIIPEDNRSNNITPLIITVIAVIAFTIFVTLGLLICGYFYFK